jgi:peptidoglycan/LPS O-acetylase OafA/YrhL
VLAHRREIDGLRAFAVLPVILFHTGLKPFSGGFVGVDVFFVISGYLITSIIRGEMEAGTFSLLRFYERRARRILPALFFVMLATVPFAWSWLLPTDMKDYAQSVAAVPLFVSNVLFWQQSGYFDTATDLKPLLHTWSLAVEEQYYVLYPLFFVLAWRFGKYFIIAALALIAAASLLVAQRLAVANPSFAFYLLPTRGWEILVGCLLALTTAPVEPGPSAARASGRQEFGALAGISLITYAVVSFDGRTPVPGVHALIPVAGAALVILFASPGTTVGKLLGHPLPVGLGLISYSAYLWHQPLFAFAKYRTIYEPRKELLALLAIGSVLLAYLTWRFVEQPFRGRSRVSGKRLAISAGACSALLISFGFIGALDGGYPDMAARPLDAQLATQGVDLPRNDNGWCFYSFGPQTRLTIGKDGWACMLGDRTSRVKAILFGDSFAGQYEPFWDIVGREAGININAVTTNWCYPSATNEFNGPALDAYSQCLLNRKYLKQQLGQVDLVVFGGDWQSVLAGGKLQGAYDAIAMAANQTKLVVVMASPRRFDSDVHRLLAKARAFGTPFDFNRISHNADASTVEANRRLAAFSMKFKNVIYVGRDALFTVDGTPSDLTAENLPFSWDGVHISISGSKAAARSFLATRQFQEFNERIRSFR